TRNFARAKSTRGIVDLGTETKTSQCPTRKQLFASLRKSCTERTMERNCVDNDSHRVGAVAVKHYAGRRLGYYRIIDLKLSIACRCGKSRYPASAFPASPGVVYRSSSNYEVHRRGLN